MAAPEHINSEDDWFGSDNLEGFSIINPDEAEPRVKIPSLIKEHKEVIATAAVIGLGVLTGRAVVKHQRQRKENQE